MKNNILNLLRVAAFGFHAGYAGAALALLDWAWQLEHNSREALPSKAHYQHKRDLDLEVKEQVSKGVQQNEGKMPHILIIGALGRCGKGVSKPHMIGRSILILGSPRPLSAVAKLVSQKRIF